MNYADVVAESLLKIHAVTLSPDKPYTWASGLKAPIYTDNRLTISYPAVRQAIYEGMSQLIQDHFPTTEVIAGTATAGIPHAAWVADQMKRPLIYVRSKAKDHGQGKQIEGHLEPGQRVVVIDDLISTGGSVLKAVKAVREAGARVLGVVSVFTYDLPEADDNMGSAGVKSYSVTDYNTLIQIAAHHNLISNDHLESLQRWRQSPLLWSKEHSNK